MRIEMAKGVALSVDTWSASWKSNKRHHFLTHAHKDHSVSITSHSSFPIYSTLLTKTLLLQQYPQVPLIEERAPQPCKQTKSPVKQCSNAVASEELSVINIPSQTVSSVPQQEFLDGVEAKWERSPERNEDLHQMKYQQLEVQESTRVHKSASYLSIGSSGLSEHDRNYYRSINVRVPQPLPSLRDLMKSNKRAKREEFAAAR